MEFPRHTKTSNHHHPLQRLVQAFAQRDGRLAGGGFVFAQVDDETLIFLYVVDVFKLLPEATRSALRVAGLWPYAIIPCMIKLRFPDEQAQRKALGFLTGRFPYKAFKDGPTLVPEDALASLAGEGILFSVDGPASYDEIVSTVRVTAAAKVQ
jgi:hypothetical protein